MRTTLPPSIQSPTPEPCSCNGQERSRENTALTVEPRCASDSNCPERAKVTEIYERVSDSNNHPNGVAIGSCATERATPLVRSGCLIPTNVASRKRPDSSILYMYMYTGMPRGFLRERFLALEGEGLTWTGQPSRQEIALFSLRIQFGEAVRPGKADMFSRRR